MAKEKYISLKEAAAMSGYSSDYVGQLIRGGKLPGKQVFSNVAWMTTEEAIYEYLENNKKSSTGAVTMGWREYMLSLIDLETLYKMVLGGTVALMAIFILFLVYILSVGIDRHIDQTYQQKIEHI